MYYGGFRRCCRPIICCRPVCCPCPFFGHRGFGRGGFAAGVGLGLLFGVF